MSKMTWLMIGGVGFLLGSRAGRGPYERFTSTIDDLASSPVVRDAALQARRAVENATRDVAQRVTGDRRPRDGADLPAGLA
ncbi:hypothetical protein [Demequina sp. NBRC 110053]|uniref:hypothetical protein n=1 Tax=Demequina sp. NBRC 110053 TaxID=1570342 RepID=UPI0009FEC2FF|nr:hypothetical protein [Demequina sp. NBRC 110053]